MKNMNYYYYILNGKQEGKVTDEEFGRLGLPVDTLVWCAGMKEWTPARDVAELQPFLDAGTPPPPPGGGQTPPHYGQQVNNGGQAQYGGGRSQYGGQQGQYGGSQPDRATMAAQRTNYLVWAILATVLCCVPTGVASIVYANKSNSAFELGDYEQAEAANKNARLWLFISVGLGVVGGILSFAFGFMSALFG